MADPARPALAEVLAALLDCRPGEETPAQWLVMPGCRLSFGVVAASQGPRDGAHFVVPRFRVAGLLTTERDVRRAWITTDPAEAWEILDARGLLPPEGARGFWCGRCNGGGSIALGGEYPERGHCDVCSVEDVTATGGVRARGWVDRSATIPDLVAWASLGAEAIVTAEALAVEACRDLREWGVAPCERVVWMVDGRPRDRWTPSHASHEFTLCVDGVTARKGSGSVSRTVAPVRALWDAGLALERVGAECVVCVPPIGGGRG